MPQRHFSVIINPDAWDASLEELARAVAPMTSVRAQQLVPVLRRGAMTIDADLSREESNRLFERLASLDVPVRIVDGDGSVVRESSDGAEEPETPDTSAEQQTGDAREDLVPELDEPEEELTEPEGGWEAFLGDVDVEDIEVAEPEAPESAAPEPKERRSSTMLGAPGSASAAPDKPAPTFELPSPSDAQQFGAEPSSATSSKATSSKEAASAGAGDEERSPPPQIPSRGVDGEPTARAAPSKPRRAPSAEMPRAEREVAEQGFDASRMNAALDSDSERPPFEPEGFDDRNEHIPALAAALSFIAPGAGQTYNGQPDKSWEFGIRFALLVPWYKSVRQAWERAEKIRTYYAPWPVEGSLIRALKYAASWWIIVGGAVALLGFGGYASYHALTRPERPEITDADIQSAHDEARRQIRMARISGLDGVSSYLDERDAAGQRFTMSEEERVERLFRRGYQSCESRQYGTCEAVMKRVSSLSPKYRREAYKLQAWASMQRAPDSKDQPMPTVEIDSLETFETREMNPDEASPEDPGSAQDVPSEAQGQPPAVDAPDLDTPDDSEDPL
ncbi:MAG: hypothetical protein ACQEVA_02235 [Myxococcota bacterium]